MLSTRDARPTPPKAAKVTADKAEAGIDRSEIDSRERHYLTLCKFASGLATNVFFEPHEEERFKLGLMRQLGFDRFHMVGDDRGGRTGHRMALDHPEAVISLSVMDIVPTYAMFMDANRFVASA